jgi:hypothetical protein
LFHHLVAKNGSMNYSIRIKKIKNEAFNTLAVWLSDEADPDNSTPADNATTYAVICYKHIIVEELYQSGGNEEQVSQSIIREFSIDFEDVTANLLTLAGEVVQNQMKDIVELFIRGCVYDQMVKLS